MMRDLPLFTLMYPPPHMTCMYPPHMYQGCTAQLMRDLPLFTLMFGSYEMMQDYYTSNFLVEKDKWGKVFFCVCGWLLRGECKITTQPISLSKRTNGARGHGVVCVCVCVCV